MNTLKQVTVINVNLNLSSPLNVQTQVGAVQPLRALVIRNSRCGDTKAIQPSLLADYVENALI